MGYGMLHGCCCCHFFFIVDVVGLLVLLLLLMMLLFQVDQLKNPSKGFETVIQNHFKLKKNLVLEEVT